MLSNLKMILAPELKATHVVRPQCPLNLENAINTNRTSRWFAETPSRAQTSIAGLPELIIKVADTSEACDRVEKASLYANSELRSCGSCSWVRSAWKCVATPRQIRPHHLEHLTARVFN